MRCLLRVEYTFMHLYIFGFSSWGSLLRPRWLRADSLGKSYDCCSHVSWRPGHVDYQARDGCSGRAGSNHAAGLATPLGPAAAVVLGLPVGQLALDVGPSMGCCSRLNCRAGHAVDVGPRTGMAPAPAEACSCPGNYRC